MAPAPDPHVAAHEAADQPDELMVVGRLVAAQGLAGELRVLPMSDFPQRFTRPGRRWLQRGQDPARTVELLHGRQLPGRELFVVRFAGIECRDAAEALVGHQLLVDAADRPALQPGEFHLLDLVGLQVRLLDDAGNGTAADGPAASIGTVTDLIHAGNDLLEVELTAGRRVLIPFVKEIVPQVHLQEGWIGLTPPAGLLDL
jgi:16S rRNA processing protein RimM